MCMISKPEHTSQQLNQLPHWAVGGAFRLYADRAGMDFNFERYKEDCPNWALFGYAYYNGPRCVDGVDVLRSLTSMITILDKHWRNDPENFPQVFSEFAQKNGFDIYLTHKSDQ